MRLVPIYTPENDSFISRVYVNPALVVLDNSGLTAVSTMPLKFDFDHQLLALSYDDGLSKTHPIHQSDKIAPYPAITKILVGVMDRVKVVDVSRIASFSFSDTVNSEYQKIDAVVEVEVKLSELFTFVDPNGTQAIKIKISLGGTVGLVDGRLRIEASADIIITDKVSVVVRRVLQESVELLGFDILAHRTSR